MSWFFKIVLPLKLFIPYSTAKTKNLLVIGTFSVSVSPLHVIVLPFRLIGLIIVTVALMKEPLIEVTCATIDEEFSARFFVVLTISFTLKLSVKVGVVLVLISQFRNGNSSLVHQNNAI